MMMKGKLERKRNGPPHLVPLSEQAVAILRDLYPLTGPEGVRFSKPQGRSAHVGRLY